MTCKVVRSYQDGVAKAFRRQAVVIFGRCQWCNKKLRYETSTVDHVKPVALGGHDGYDNFCVACRECNSRKGCELRGKPPYGPADWSLLIRPPEFQECFHAAWNTSAGRTSSGKFDRHKVYRDGRPTFFGSLSQCRYQAARLREAFPAADVQILYCDEELQETA